MFAPYGTTSNAAQIAPSSAQVEEGQSNILQLKLILQLLLLSPAITHPIPIFFISLSSNVSITSDLSVYMSNTFFFLILLANLFVTFYLLLLFVLLPPLYLRY